MALYLCSLLLLYTWYVLFPACVTATHKQQTGTAAVAVRRTGHVCLWSNILSTVITYRLNGFWPANTANVPGPVCEIRDPLDCRLYWNGSYAVLSEGKRNNNN